MNFLIFGCQVLYRGEIHYTIIMLRRKEQNTGVSGGGRRIVHMSRNDAWDKRTCRGRRRILYPAGVVLLLILAAGVFLALRVRGSVAVHAKKEIMPQDGEFYCMDPQKDGERSLAEYGNRIYAARVVRPVKDSASRRVFLRSNQSVNRDTGDTENRTPFGTDAAINAL